MVVVEEVWVTEGGGCEAEINIMIPCPAAILGKQTSDITAAWVFLVRFFFFVDCTLCLGTEECFFLKKVAFSNKNKHSILHYSYQLFIWIVNSVFPVLRSNLCQSQVNTIMCHKDFARSGAVLVHRG